MGSEVSQGCQQAEDFAGFLTDYKKKNSRSTVPHYSREESMQQKWTERFLSVLAEYQHKPQQAYCGRLRTVIAGMGEEMFIKAQTIISAMDNQKVAQVTSKEVFKDTIRLDVCPRSKNVCISDPKQHATKRHNQAMYAQSFQENKSSRQQMVKQVSYVLVREINQLHHPASLLKECFVEMFEEKFTFVLARHSDSRQESIERLHAEMHEDIMFYCSLIRDGCKRAYQSWVQRNLQLPQNKYENMIGDVALLSLFAGGSMYQALFLLVRSINYCRSAAVKQIPDALHVSCFQIRKELEIDGKFNKALALLAKIQSISCPKYLVRALANLKHEICNDIDQYYAASSIQKQLGIDSDNLLAIVCYLLCQNKPRLLHILSQMHVLTVIYGEDMSTVFEDSSYMYSVLLTALDIVMGPDLSHNFNLGAAS